MRLLSRHRLLLPSVLKTVMWQWLLLLSSNNPHHFLSKTLSVGSVVVFIVSGGVIACWNQIGHACTTQMKQRCIYPAVCHCLQFNLIYLSAAWVSFFVCLDKNKALSSARSNGRRKCGRNELFDNRWGAASDRLHATSCALLDGNYFHWWQHEIRWWSQVFSDWRLYWNNISLLGCTVSKHSIQSQWHRSSMSVFYNIKLLAWHPQVSRKDCNQIRASLTLPLLTHSNSFPEPFLILTGRTDLDNTSLAFIDACWRRVKGSPEGDNWCCWNRSREDRCCHVSD